MRLAQITDLHIWSAEAGHGEGPANADGLRRCVAAINALTPAPDLVLATGDLINEGTEGEYAHLKALLAPLRAPVKLMVGNHDARAPLRAVFGDHDYLGTDGFVQFALDVGPVRLLCLDTLADGKIGGCQCPARLAWLEARLQDVPGRPTLIALHHPPARLGIPVFDGFGFDGLDGFAEIVARHSHVIGIIAGHVHRPIQARVGGAPLVIAPSPADGYGLVEVPGEPMVRENTLTGFALHSFTAERGLASHYVSLPAA